MAESPGLAASDLSKACASKWKGLSAEERAVYQAEASKLAAEFRQEFPDYRYKKNKKEKRIAAMACKLGDVDALQFLNHMFQGNPFLFQQLVSEKGEQGRPNVSKLFFPE
jgi:hypothetical protein